MNLTHDTAAPGALARRGAPELAHLRRYGRWAVVTGASDGIGRAFAQELARAGLDLVLIARREERLRELADALEAAHGARSVVISADLGSAQGVAVALRQIEQIEDVGLLVASAGFGTSGPFVEASLEQELAMIDVNCRAVAAMTHHLGKRFVAQGKGGIVLLSSLLAFQGVPRAANYAATKAYVQSLAEGLRGELGPRGVDVIACAPGPIQSGFAARANMQMGMTQPPEAVALTTLRALGRWGTVRPGWLAKLLEASLAALPRWGRTQVLTRVMGGMTSHQA